jgi:hypothetical protein
MMLDFLSCPGCRSGENRCRQCPRRHGERIVSRRDQQEGADITRIVWRVACDCGVDFTVTALARVDSVRLPWPAA